jgi:hypothetical protein
MNNVMKVVAVCAICGRRADVHDTGRLRSRHTFRAVEDAA